MASRPVRVYFVQRPFQRERQRDTIEHLPEPFVAVGRAPGPDLPDHEVNVRGAASLRRRMAVALTRTGAPVNVGVVLDRRAAGCDLLYTWGKLPLWPRRPRFVVELDNPYVLTLYRNVGALSRLRPVLRRALLSRRCAGLVCISGACRASTAALLGEDVADRAHVVYPYVAAPPRPASPGAGDGRLEVLFVGTQFHLKGGRELCAAFARVAVDLPQARLTVVSRVPEEIRAAHRSDPIRFLDPRPRREIIEELLPAADLFAMPSMLESFGMAALEAVAAGLPVLTTDVYALREIVEDGCNGVLLPDPLRVWRGAAADPTLAREPDLDEHVRRRSWPDFQARLEAELRALLSDRARLGAMGAASAERFAARFAPERRAAAFAAAMGEMAQAA